jgi:polyisoprenoid-binding protein YceI
MRRSKIVQVAVVLVVLVVLAAGGAFWWAYLRDDAPEEAQLVDRANAEQTDSSTLDGTWTVAPGPEVFAGYRIDERTVVGVDNTAVARTGDVEGQLVVDGSEITEISVIADLATLVSQDDQVPGVGNRDAAMRGAGLETDTFPTATFTSTDPVDLGTLPEPGEEVRIDVPGELELHGVVQPVTVAVVARWNGELIDLTASTDVVLADHGIEQPAVQVVTVADVGTIELQLTFEPAD